MNMQAGGAVTAIKHTGVTIGKEELENARKTLEEFRAAKAPSMRRSSATSSGTAAATRH